MRARQLLVWGVAALAALALAGAAALSGQETLQISSAVVRITTTADGLTALVSVDGTAADTADGKVDYAFVVQSEVPLDMTAFSGRATVMFTKHRLVVRREDGTGWVFTVSGKDPDVFIEAPAELIVPVVGLVHYWGLSSGLSHEALVEQLLVRKCEVSLLDEGEGDRCTDCEAGGHGEQACGVSCETRDCSADCLDGYFACCKCSTGCGCCKEIEQ